jgi:phage terminase small subunit
MPRTVKKDANLKPGKPEKPVNLSARAAVAWDRLVSQLEGAQIQLTTAHSSLLSIASTLSADIADAWEVVKEKGAYVTNHKTGAVQEHPASKKLDALRRDLIQGPYVSERASHARSAQVRRSKPGGHSFRQG